MAQSYVGWWVQGLSCMKYFEYQIPFFRVPETPVAYLVKVFSKSENLE